jgi:hypothetical protein
MEALRMFDESGAFEVWENVIGRFQLPANRKIPETLLYDVIMFKWAYGL